MNPHQQIIKTKNIINDLKFELQYSKNKVKDAKRINDLIDLVESFEDMLVSKYRTDAVEALLYSLIYEWLLQSVGKEIPLNLMVHNIDNDIFYGPQLKKLEVIDLLKTNELQKKIDNNTVFDGIYCNFDKMLEKLVNEFKNNIHWTKSE